MKSYLIVLLALIAGYKLYITTEFVQQISCYSDYSMVEWGELSEKYYRPNTADWDEAIEKQIIEGFPREFAAQYWHLLQNARTDFHQKSLPLRAEASKNIIKALDRTEGMFDTVFVRCASQEYYMRLFPEIYNETMKPAIDQLIENINNYDNLL